MLQESKQCSLTQGQLDWLFNLGYQPPPEEAFDHPGLVAIDGDFVQERCPNPRENERVCFVPFLLKGLGFPVHPFLRGLLYFYGLQLHHLSPNSILHIACYVMLCEAFLGCLSHFGLWCKYFCALPRKRGNTLLSCGGAVIYIVAGSGYLDGSPEESDENWQEEWFYLPDVPLVDPPQTSVATTFSPDPPRKLYNCRPKPRG